MAAHRYRLPGLRLRLLVVLALLACLSTAGTAGAGGRSAGAAAPVGLSTVAPARPNILVLMSDDQAWSVFNRTLMPSVYSKLVDQGVLFNRFYDDTPTCCPSRSQILTGLFERHNGVDDNILPTNVSPRPVSGLRRPTFVEAMHDHGYRTLLSGKFLNVESCAARPEFDHFSCTKTYGKKNPVVVDDGVSQQTTGYTTEVLADRLIQQLDQTPTDKPFFAFYTPTSPHMPAADDDRYASLPVPLLRPRDYDADTVRADLPEYTRRPAIEPRLRGSFDYQYRSMARATRGLDDSVGRILDSLDSRLDDTFVVYLSDNGFMYGEHRWSTKYAPWEESVRVPMVIRYPGLRSTLASTATDAPAENVDLAATLADLAGVPWGSDGVSLLPAVVDPTARPRRDVLLESCQGSSSSDGCPIRWQYNYNDAGANSGAVVPTVPALTAVVTDRYKYIQYTSDKPQLYDLQSDPYELANLAGTPGAATVQSDLQQRLAALTGPSPVDTTIVSGFAGLADSRAKRFTFFSQSRFATYRCRLTSGGVVGAWHPCSGGQSEVVGPLADGSYTFEVAGSDETGATDPTPASRSFVVQSSGPPVQIDSAPPTRSTGDVAAFRFSSQDPSATLSCSMTPLLAAPVWAPCDPATGASYSGLKDGVWSFQVRAVALGGMTSAVPAQALVDVDRTAPVVTFDPRVPAQRATGNLSVSFSVNEPATLRCRLDSTPAVPCQGGAFSRTGLSVGVHRLVVSAKDDLGNAGTTAATTTVITQRPTVTFTATPPSATTSRTATFTLSGQSPSAPTLSLATFRLRLDAGPLFPSWTTAVLPRLTVGRHTLTASAVDRAGNVSAPISYTWQVT